MIALIPERESNLISFTRKEEKIVEASKNIDRLVDIDISKTVKEVKTEVAAKTAPETEIKTVKTVKEIKRDKTPPHNPRTNIFNVSQLNNKEYLEADGDDDTGGVHETMVEGTDKAKNIIAEPEIESPNNLHNNHYHIPAKHLTNHPLTYSSIQIRNAQF